MASLTGMLLLLQKKRRSCEKSCFQHDCMTDCKIYVCVLCCFCIVLSDGFAEFCFVLSDLFEVGLPLLVDSNPGCLGCCMDHAFLLCQHC